LCEEGVHLRRGAYHLLVGVFLERRRLLQRQRKRKARAQKQARAKAKKRIRIKTKQTKRRKAH
jgi:hypothetical protein